MDTLPRLVVHTECHNDAIRSEHREQVFVNFLCSVGIWRGTSCELHEHVRDAGVDNTIEGADKFFWYGSLQIKEGWL